MMRCTSSVLVLCSCLLSGALWGGNPDLEVEVEAGFLGLVKAERWVQLTARLRNDGPAMEAEVWTETTAGRFGRRVSLGTPSRKIVRFPAILTTRTSRLLIRVSANGSVLQTVEAPLKWVDRADSLTLLLAPADDTSPRTHATGIPGSRLVRISLVEFPDRWWGLDFVDRVIVREDLAERLVERQMDALRRWVLLGGTCVLLPTEDASASPLNSALEVRREPGPARIGYGRGEIIVLESTDPHAVLDGTRQPRGDALSSIDRFDGDLLGWDAGTAATQRPPLLSGGLAVLYGLLCALLIFLLPRYCSSVRTMLIGLTVPPLAGSLLITNQEVVFFNGCPEIHTTSILHCFPGSTDQFVSSRLDLTARSRRSVTVETGESSAVGFELTHPNQVTQFSSRGGTELAASLSMDLFERRSLLFSGFQSEILSLQYEPGLLLIDAPPAQTVVGCHLLSAAGIRRLDFQSRDQGVAVTVEPGPPTVDDPVSRELQFPNFDRIPSIVKQFRRVEPETESLILCTVEALPCFLSVAGGPPTPADSGLVVLHLPENRGIGVEYP